MSKTTQPRNEDALVEELGRGQAEKRAHQPKPGNGAALNEDYNAKS